jgi:hypothetical protein
MPTARWHQGADFAHEVPSNKRFVQPFLLSSVSTRLPAAACLPEAAP